VHPAGKNFVDSHGASFVGFGITRLLDFDLIARFKQISTMKLYVPGRGDQHAYPALAPALTRLVRWDVIENNYDLMMKYATAIRLRTASTEALLRYPVRVCQLKGVTSSSVVTCVPR
jgi:TnpA family transposase